VVEEAEQGFETRCNRILKPEAAVCGRIGPSVHRFENPRDSRIISWETSDSGKETGLASIR
jgi:hypothetical protein